MPPFQPPMAFFQRVGAAGGPFGTLQRLTKLYNDTKQSYEFAKVTPAGANVNDDAEVKALRKDFQIQQDRLLAWGMHWADVEAQYNQGQDVDIDKKIDQAGLGEVVAEVMSQIKSLLDQSGRLQHPEKYEMAKMGLPPIGTNPRRKEWSEHEVQTGRALLEQLKTCIDVLYSMTDTRKAEEKSSKGEKSEKGDKKGVRGLEDDIETALYGRKPHSTSAFHGLRDHPLHIDWSLIDLSGAPPDSAEPPPYDATAPTLPASIKDRAIGFHQGESKSMLVEFLSSDIPPHVIGTADDIFELHELGQALCKQRKQLSWCGHLRLLGFTVDPNGPRCGIVYELPPAQGYQMQQHKTLSAAISATYNQESTQPALEDRFRLAYNLSLAVLGYFANGDNHRCLNSNDILLIGKDSNGRLTPAPILTKPDVRSPFIIQSCQDLTTKAKVDEPLTATIYRHPTHDVQNNDMILPAHDIYSLGLMLLEIGFWIPLLKLWKEKYNRQMFMERIQRVYSPKLASKCGSKYMKVVQKCLHAPAELLGKTRPEEAAIHLLEVVKDLRQCCALDEEGMPPSSDIECFEVLVIEQMCKNESFPSDQPAQSSSLPPLKIPGSFTQDQETGVMRSGLSAVKRKPLREKALPEIPAQSESRKASKKRSKAASALHKWPEMPIAQEDLDQWNSLLLPKLSKILQDALQDSPESCSVSLMKIGPTQENAKTTICIQCKDTAKVNEVLRKRFKPKKGWGVVILKGDVRRCAVKRSRRPRRSGGRRGVKPREQKYQEKPSCGASIGAFRDNEHLPPVSFGGTILVDGEPFGMTVHHMLDTPSESESDSSEEEAEQPLRSAAPRASQRRGMEGSADFSFMSADDDIRHFSDLEISSDSPDDADDESDGESDASTIRPDYSITDSDGNEFWFLDDSSDTSAPELVEDDSDEEDDDDDEEEDSDDEDDSASIGDKPPFLPYHEDTETLTVTQPAIDDVDDDFFPSLEDKDDDHLDSHTFGFVHASSGIRRVTKGGLKHEIDWALIRIEDDRLDTANTVAHGTAARGGGSRRGRTQKQRQSMSHTGPIPALTKITPIDKLSARTVACRARSSGFSSGRISQAMCLVKLHGRHTFSYSWCVDSTPAKLTSQLQATHPTTSTMPSRPKSAAAAKATAKGGDLGIPGDSGAWIYDPVSGELCGHVLAYGEKMRQAYIAPMEVLFEDIRRKLGAGDVRLPGQVEVNAVETGGITQATAAAATATVTVTASGTPGRREEVWREDSGVDMGEDMRLEAASVAARERERECELQKEIELRSGLRDLRIGEQHVSGHGTGQGQGQGKGKAVDVAGPGPVALDVKLQQQGPSCGKVGARA